jgi:hypothetical protein
MAENINFIPANQLPEATGNEVEVLCLENGEMKRKTGSLGGGAYVIDLTDSTEINFDENQSIITTVNYDDFAEHWYKGGTVAFKIMYSGMESFMYPWAGSYVAGTGLIFVFMPKMVNSAPHQAIFANGTWTPPTE